MHKLRHEAKSVKVRTSLENFICKYNLEPPLNSQFTYFERSVIGSNDLYDTDDKGKIKDYSDNSEDFIQDDADESYVDEPKAVKGENERTLLQIPVESLPCPQDVKSVTDRTYTYPSQNEAKDYRNLISSSSNIHNKNVYLIPLIFLVLKVYRIWTIIL